MVAYGKILFILKKSDEFLLEGPHLPLLIKGCDLLEHATEEQSILRGETRPKVADQLRRRRLVVPRPEVITDGHNEALLVPFQDFLRLFLVLDASGTVSQDKR